MSMCNTDDYSKAELRSYISDYIPDQMIDLMLLDFKLGITMLP